MCYNYFMAGNTFGEIFRVTTFGETHGNALGVVIDGCPSNIALSEDIIQKDLNRRRPGNHDGKNAAVTPRKENDTVEILSGVFEGVTTGVPISLMIRNENQKSKDYSAIAKVFRPGHADYTYFQKYGVRDYRGGGRSSGRETCARVAAGSVAKLVLKQAQTNIEILTYTKEACGIKATTIDTKTLTQDVVELNQMRTVDEISSKTMLTKVEELQKTGNSGGGIIECIIRNVPTGWGEGVFDKLDAELAKAMLSIGAVKGIEFGAGFDSSTMTGSEWNDPMRLDANGNPDYESNNAGGILGGMSNGNDIIFRVAIKPVPSISIEQQTVCIQADGTYKNTEISVHGRHDVCLCPRIVPVVESMVAITLADFCLRNKATRV